jgi:hypothetical protein
VIRELDVRAILTKTGRPYDKTSLLKTLHNKVYRGLAVHKGDAYPGEHDAIRLDAGKSFVISDFGWGIGMQTYPRNPSIYAGIPSNAPTACSGYVAIDVVRNARLGFGGVRKQIVEI